MKLYSQVDLQFHHPVLFGLRIYMCQSCAEPCTNSIGLIPKYLPRKRFKTTAIEIRPAWYCFHRGRSNSNTRTSCTCMTVVDNKDEILHFWQLRIRNTSYDNFLTRMSMASFVLP